MKKHTTNYSFSRNTPTPQLEDTITALRSKEISREIDTEMAWFLSVTTFRDRGWHMANIDNLQNKETDSDIEQWITKNIKGEYRRNGKHFIFEQRKDANWFILRWGLRDTNETETK